ncbi:amino acid deaminase [Granulicella sibirica]|uniref:D-serine deaminase n=1 Tax=Granulicella sibirica TaxID=2479048 RepID=A0A4Q0SZ34_9BACT|nr:amino acid deaminase [Granulicella sibirica]RXH56505.1 D-serine deaminase [Granulicella sibirica]
MKDCPLSSLNKGVGHLEQPAPSGDITSFGWNLLHEDLSLPTAVLYEDRLKHNADWMQSFIAAYGVKLAPHGKTTMSPKLFDLQLKTGAWGITLATPHQTLVAYEHGVRRILMANQLIGKENMAIISRLLQDPAFEFFCLVDSVAQIEQLGTLFSRKNQRLKVLIELGVTGGRTGVRDEAQLQSVLEALTTWTSSLALCGVEMYEGVLKEEDAIRDFLKRAASVTQTLMEQGRFVRTPAILSGAGSAWYDVVAEVFSSAGFGESVDIILRPGCYLTHDIGVYRDAQTKIEQRNPIAHSMRSGLLPALQVWAYVQSIPEPEKAIIALGKRDAAFDLGLPLPTLHFRPGASEPSPASGHWTLTNMMDQHAYMTISEGDDLHVGDMIGFDISHPCLTFDKWRSLLVLNAKYQVIDAIQTFF